MDAENPAEVLVVNALSDVVLGERGVLDDDESRAIVADSYERAVSADRRDAFEAEIGSLAGLTEGESVETSDDFDVVVEEVLSDLERKGVRSVVDHRSRIEFPPRAVGVYNFLQSADPDVVTDFSLPSAVRSTVRDGLERAAEDEFDGAIDSLESALATVRGKTDLEDAPITVRILLGWAYFWAGDRAAAADIADEALTLCSDCWDAKLLWISATHQREVRRGTFDVGLFLKWLSSVPEDGSLDVWVATEADETEWQGLSSPSEYSDYAVLDRLGTETWIRFRLEGPLPTVPKLFAYHLGVGTIDHRKRAVEETERVLRTGPMADDVTERLSFTY